jgi:hypothetical protein
MLFRTALLEFEVNTRKLFRPWTGGNLYCRCADREAWIEWYPGRRKRPQAGTGQMGLPSTQKKQPVDQRVG